MSNELDQEQVILKNHVIAGSYSIAAMYQVKNPGPQDLVLLLPPERGLLALLEGKKGA
jgi:hypothetical protein